MAQPYVGEIRMFAGNFAPAGWHFCDGAPMAISENETLFQLLGTTYGGDFGANRCTVKPQTVPVSLSSSGSEDR